MENLDELLPQVDPLLCPESDAADCARYAFVNSSINGYLRDMYFVPP
jgi:hypothetical protein